MSILLDALKKSEKQRQLGQTPTLQTPFAEQPEATASSSHWIPLLMLVVSVSVMSWFGWKQLRAPDIAASSSEPVASVQSERPEIQPGEESGQRTPTEKYQPDVIRPGEVRDLQQARVTVNAEARARLSRSVSEFASEDAEPEPAGQADDLTADAEPVAMPVPDIEPEAQRQQSRGAGIEPHVSEPISFWELPQGVRDSLPEIRITVLVYADQPEDRFLLTNGQRMVEKDELQGGLVLDEIRRDGAVFLYRKYRFLVKG